MGEGNEKMQHKFFLESILKCWDIVTKDLPGGELSYKVIKNEFRDNSQFTISYKYPSYDINSKENIKDIIKDAIKVFKDNLPKDHAKTIKRQSNNELYGNWNGLSFHLTVKIGKDDGTSWKGGSKTPFVKERLMMNYSLYFYSPTKHVDLTRACLKEAGIQEA